MLSNNELPRFLYPQLGGTLICLRLPRLSADLPPPLPTALITAAGVESWPDAHECLLVLWCAAEQALDVCSAVKRYGDPIDWPGQLKISGAWRVVSGVPRVLSKDEMEDELNEVMINVPAWLERVQAEHAFA